MYDVYMTALLSVSIYLLYTSQTYDAMQKKDEISNLWRNPMQQFDVIVWFNEFRRQT